MQRGDKWNWAFVTSAVILIAIHLFMLYYRIQIESPGRHVHKLTYGFAGAFSPICAAPVLLIFAGIAAAILKSKTPLIGTSIGIALCYPLLMASFVVAIIAMSLLVPQAASVFVLPAGILIWGVVKKPKQKKKSTRQESQQENDIFA